MSRKSKFKPSQNKHLILTIILAIIVVVLLSSQIKQLLMPYFYKASASGVSFSAGQWISDTGAEEVPGWSGVPNPTTSDWIGLYASGSADTSPIARYYDSWTTSRSICPTTPGPTAQAAGSCLFPIPLNITPGNYELRLFSNNTYTRIASGSFIVSTPNLTASPANVLAGGSTSFSWQNQARSSYTNWIGFFAKGAPNSARIDWDYVSCTKTPTSDIRQGTCAFTVPSNLATGTYEFRFFDDAYGQTGTSNPIALTGIVIPTATPTPTPKATTGTITGTIHSSTGILVIGAKISLTVSGVKETFTSDGQGHYLIPSLPPASYLLTFVSAGYSDQKSTLTVSAGQTITHNVTLKPKK